MAASDDDGRTVLNFQTFMNKTGIRANSIASAANSNSGSVVEELADP